MIPAAKASSTPQNIAGNELQLGRVQGFKPKDVEDLRLGPCGNGKDCLFIGDIGDNDLKRRTIEVIVVEEPSADERTNTDFANASGCDIPIGLTMPESLAVHPDGTILVLTKNENGFGTAVPADQDAMAEYRRHRGQCWPGRIDQHAIDIAKYGFVWNKTPPQWIYRVTESDSGTDLRDAIEFTIDIRKPEPLSLPAPNPGGLPDAAGGGGLHT